MTIKQDLKVYSVNPLYLIFNKKNGYFNWLKTNGNEYLTLVPTNKSKEKITKYEEIGSIMRNFIKLVTKKIRWLWWKIDENQIWFRWKPNFK